jgi:tetratricopeptide (TPR) repeat protein
MHDHEGVKRTVADLRAAHPELLHDAELHELSGASLARDGKVDEALVELGKAPAPAPLSAVAVQAEKAPQTAYARCATRRAELHLERGRPDLALDAVLGARQVLDPRMRESHVRLLRAAFKARLRARAFSDARETLAELRSFVPDVEGEIDLLLAEGRRAEALERLGQAARTLPDRLDLVDRYASELAVDADSGAAMVFLEEAETRLVASLDRRKQGRSASDSWAVDAWTPTLLAWLDRSRAGVQQASGDLDGAVVSLRAALEHRPNDPHTLNHLAYLCSLRGLDLEEAQSMILRALEQQPFSGPMQDTYGWVLHRLGHDEAAREALELAERYHPGDPENLHHLGEVYLRLGLRDAARTHFEEALRAVDESDPHHRRVAESVRAGLRALEEPVQAREPTSGAEPPR